jgi:hypothetical protein
MDDVKTGGITDLQDKFRGNLIQALVWNVGTCRPDVKGEIQVEDPTRISVPMRGMGAEQSGVGRKAL